MSTAKYSTSILFGLACAAALLISPAQAQFTPDDVESAAGMGTYLDLTNDPAGTTRNGTTMIWSGNNVAGAWDFPDTSDGSEFVGGSSADDKEADGGTAPIGLDFSGLLPSTEYNIFLAARARPAGNDEGGDISWGLAADSLATVNFDADNMPAGSVEVNSDTDNDFLALLKVGSLASDGSGALSLFVGEGLPWQNTPPRNRTQFDGVLLSVVPEPGTIALGLLAAAAALLTCRRR